MAGGEGRINYAHAEVVVDNVEVPLREARDNYVHADVLVDNVAEKIPHEARTNYAHADVVVTNVNEQILHEARLNYAHVDVVVSNIRSTIELATYSLAVSSAAGDAGTYVVVPDPLRIPPLHVVKSLSARIVSRGGLFR